MNSLINTNPMTHIAGGTDTHQAAAWQGHTCHPAYDILSTLFLIYSNIKIHKTEVATLLTWGHIKARSPSISFLSPSLFLVTLLYFKYYSAFVLENPSKHAWPMSLQLSESHNTWSSFICYNLLLNNFTSIHETCVKFYLKAPTVCFK